MKTKERPILLSAPEVMSILSGDKKQIRRICKSQPYSNGFHFRNGEIMCYNDYLPPSVMLMDVGTRMYPYTTSEAEGWESECPYGQPGENMWVRESYGEVYCYCDHPEMPGAGTETWLEDYKYRADCEKPILYGKWSGWKSGIRMPRVASRILLKIVSVRVERLHDISEEDAWNEGVQDFMGAKTPWKDVLAPVSVHAYATLCESINGAGSWESNPWVWVIEFKRI